MIWSFIACPQAEGHSDWPTAIINIARGILNADWTEQLGAPLVAWQHLFQGLKFTEATRLGYVRNRDYSPSLGRFIELDPIGFDAGDNNWCRFVGNGPVGAVDPSGMIGLGIPPPVSLGINPIRWFIKKEPLILSISDLTPEEIEQVMMNEFKMKLVGKKFGVIKNFSWTHLIGLKYKAQIDSTDTEVDQHILAKYTKDRKSIIIFKEWPILTWDIQ